MKKKKTPIWQWVALVVLLFWAYKFYQESFQSDGRKITHQIDSKIGHTTFVAQSVLVAEENLEFQDGKIYYAAKGELNIPVPSDSVPLVPTLTEAGRNPLFYGTDGKWFNANTKESDLIAGIHASTKCFDESPYNSMPQWQTAKQNIPNGNVYVEIEYFEKNDAPESIGDNKGVSSFIYDSSNKMFFYIYCNY